MTAKILGHEAMKFSCMQKEEKEAGNDKYTDI